MFLKRMKRSSNAALEHKCHGGHRSEMSAQPKRGKGIITVITLFIKHLSKPSYTDSERPLVMRQDLGTVSRDVPADLRQRSG